VFGDLVQLDNGKTPIRLTPILGGTSAIVLCFLFCSGVIQGPLFPHMGTHDNPQNVFALLQNLHPPEHQDWGKLVIWSFVAGFAERFVPDLWTGLSPAPPVKKPREIAIFQIRPVIRKNGTSFQTRRFT
jgi:hypothetical protein